MTIGKPMLNKHRPAGARGEALVGRYRARMAGNDPTPVQNRFQIGKLLATFRPGMANKIFAKRIANGKSLVGTKQISETSSERNGVQVGENYPTQQFGSLQVGRSVNPVSPSYAKRVREARARNTEEGLAAGGAYMDAAIATHADPLQPLRPSVTQQRVGGALRPPGSYENSLGLIGRPLITDTRGFRGDATNPTIFY